MIIKYPYSAELYFDSTSKTVKEVYRPIIKIRLSAKSKPISFSFDALIDSGADKILLPSNIADDIGIILEKDNSRKVYGIGNSSVIVHSAKVNIWIGTKEYQTEANFSQLQEVPLLGRNGFFSLFKSIKFDEKGKCFYIEE